MCEMGHILLLAPQLINKPAIIKGDLIGVNTVLTAYSQALIF